MEQHYLPEKSHERRSLWNPRANHYFISSSHQAYSLLRFSFSMLMVIAGADKFFNFITDWSLYISPRFIAMGLDPLAFMDIIGAFEVFMGLLVLIQPRVGGLLVAGWLWAIVVNLLSIPGHYDLILRDVGLSIGAFALSRLSLEFQQYRRVRLERWSPLKTRSDGA
jgi:hypothetical protein